jgi:hypothetical protein
MGVAEFRRLTDAALGNRRGAKCTIVVGKSPATSTTKDRTAKAPTGLQRQLAPNNSWKQAWLGAFWLPRRTTGCNLAGKRLLLSAPSQKLSCSSYFVTICRHRSASDTATNANRSAGCSIKIRDRRTPQERKTSPGFASLPKAQVRAASPLSRREICFDSGIPIIPKKNHVSLLSMLAGLQY